MSLNQVLKYACVVAALTLTVAGDDEGHFIFPLPQTAQAVQLNPFKIGETLNLQWETTFNATNIVIWQSSGPNIPQTIPNAVRLGPDINSYKWLIDISGNNLNPSYNLTGGNLFFFGLFEDGTFHPYAESQIITIEDPNAISSSISSPSSTSSTILLSTQTNKATSASETYALMASITSTPPTSVPIIAGASSSASSSASTEAVMESGRSSTAKRDIGIGVGIGILVLTSLSIGGYYYYFRHKKSLAHQLSRPVTEVPQGWVYFEAKKNGPAPLMVYESSSKMVYESSPSMSDKAKIMSPIVHEVA